MTNFVFEKEKTNRMGSANLKPRRGSDTYEQGTPFTRNRPTMLPLLSRLLTL